MPGPVSEITFAAMPVRSGTKPAPSALNMPGWRILAAAIKDAVDTSGLTVQLIADRSGLSRQYIYSMMEGTCNPSMDKIEAVMKAAGTSLSAWLDDKSSYGRDKRIHDQVQLILNQKGLNAATIRRTIEALVSLSANSSEADK